MTLPPAVVSPTHGSGGESQLLVVELLREKVVGLLRREWLEALLLLLLLLLLYIRKREGMFRAVAGAALAIGIAVQKHINKSLS